MFDDCVIMAGGAGTRLWPASRKEYPKQFLPLPAQKEKTFFHAALDRAFALTGADGARVIIAAGREHIPHIENCCAAYPKDCLRRVTLIPEPESKNTAAAIACAAVFAKLASNTAASGGLPRSMLVLTSDHIIEPEADFVKQTCELEPRIRQGGLAVFGIPPRSAETGYGYIETAGAAARRRAGVFTVASFHEKPDKATAEKYLQAGNFFWNSGMFAFTSDFILNEFKKNAAGVLAPFEKLTAPGAASYRKGKGVKILENWRGLDEAYHETEQVSFDIAITEKCRDVIMVKAAFEWYDVGSWDEYARLSVQSEKNVFSVGSSSCFVDSPIPVALCGVEDLIIVVRNGSDGGSPAVLVAKKGETQRVKEIVGLINARGPAEPPPSKDNA
jgi:mannose-1-phosphate guanylyltransferase/mannose-6-phosphate isomerase